MYESIKISDGFWRIEDGGVRSLLIAGTAQALLVDTGLGTGDLRAEVERITALPVTLVNTHADGDHIGCNHQFPDCHMHAAEFDRYAQRRPAGPPPLPLWEGDVIDLGGRMVEVVLIPGHTPGSIALLDRARRALISGDTVQDGSIFMFGPGRNLPAYIASLEKLLRMAALFDTVYPAHGGVALQSGIIASLLDGARRVQRGEAAGSAMEMHGTPVMAYDVGVARLLCPAP